MATADSHGLFWNSDDGDRKYDADSFERWLRKFFTSGVFEGDLQVTASSGMTLNVATGYCNLFGKVGLFESASTVTLAPANSTYPRIDTVVIERNDTDRDIVIKAVTGAYSGNNPQPTARIWNETTGVYQLVLAQIYVAAGVSSISQSDITDKRTDTTVCGYIAGTVNEMDFSQFTAQFESYYEQFAASNQADFEAWFEEMKDQLSEDAAGHLQLEIDEINEIIAPVQLTLTASQPYAIGEQFIHEGKLYTATSAIAENDTIVIGTNADLSDEIVKQIKSVESKADANTAAIAKCEVLIIDVSSFSSLPQTVTDANIESDMVVINSIVGTPSAQVANWTVTTANGSLTISGTNAISGSTTLKLFLAKSR